MAQRERVDALERGHVKSMEEHCKTTTRREEQEGSCAHHAAAPSAAVNTPDTAAHDTKESQQREQPADTHLLAQALVQTVTNCFLKRAIDVAAAREMCSSHNHDTIDKGIMASAFVVVQNPDSKSRLQWVG